MKKYYWVLLVVGMLGSLAYVPVTDTAFTHTERTLEAQLQPGDIIFHTSTSTQSKAIQLATRSPYSHMGILYLNEGKWYVFEAVQPVQLTPLRQWINRGKDGHYVVKRLHNANKVLTPAVLEQMRQIGTQYSSKPYDLYFEWSDDRIYCSELVWKIYEQALGIEIGKRQKLADFDLSHPVVNAKLKERYGNDLPLDEIVISPAAMFHSDQLVTVVKKP